MPCTGFFLVPGPRAPGKHLRGFTEAPKMEVI